MKTPLDYITNIHKANALREQSRVRLIEYIESLDLTNYQKGKIIGWEHNYKNRMNQNISDNALIEAVERLLKADTMSAQDGPKKQ